MTETAEPRYRIFIRLDGHLSIEPETTDPITYILFIDGLYDMKTAIRIVRISYESLGRAYDADEGVALSSVGYRIDDSDLEEIDNRLLVESLYCWNGYLTVLKAHNGR